MHFVDLATRINLVWLFEILKVKVKVKLATVVEGNQKAPFSIAIKYQVSFLESLV